MSFSKASSALESPDLTACLKRQARRILSFLNVIWHPLVVIVNVSLKKKWIKIPYCNQFKISSHTPAEQLVLLLFPAKEKVKFSPSFTHFVTFFVRPHVWE